MLDVLKEKFGFTRFNEGQEKVIDCLMKGESAAAIFPTGKGKSLCYQLPATQLPHLTLVVSPLLSLIQDQLSFLQSKKISAARIDSTLERDEENQIMEDILKNKIQILMISVERFKNERFRAFLSTVKISLMVVDEAHCISEWGHNFRPDYLKLPQYQQDFKIQQVLLLTATATPRVAKDMQKKFNISASNIISTGFYRSNLHIEIDPAQGNQKNETLLKHIRPGESTIVYVTLQKSAEEVAQFLIDNGVNAQYYHAGLRNEIREKIQHDFMNGTTDVIVATIAFGMGIDKPDIRKIIHYDLPKSIENYSQEIGRAGRDNLKSDCVLIGNKDNLITLQNFVYGDTPEFESISFIIHSIPEDTNNWEIQPYQLSVLADIRLLPLKTLLVYLEIEGIIQSRYAYFKSYRFKNIIDGNEIIRQFEGERQEFVKRLLTHSQKAKTWSYIDIEDFQNKYGYERKRIISALEYFHQQNYIVLDAKGITETYEIKSRTYNSTELARKMHDLFKSKETSELKRIEQMVDLFESQQCINYQLAMYFGQTLQKKECGHCSVCLEGGKTLSSDRSYGNLDEELLNSVQEQLLEYMEEKPSTDLVTRYLCGIKTPKISKLKGEQLKDFAVYEHVPYTGVKSWVVKHSFKL